MTSTPLRRLVAAALLVLPAMFALPASAQRAASGPAVPLRIVVGFPPGGALDLLARQVAEQLRTSIGKSAALQDAAQQFARMFADIARNHEETATDDPGVKH